MEESVRKRTFDNSFDYLKPINVADVNSVVYPKKKSTTEATGITPIEFLINKPVKYKPLPNTSTKDLNYDVSVTVPYLVSGSSSSVLNAPAPQSIYPPVLPDKLIDNKLVQRKRLKEILNYDDAQDKIFINDSLIEPAIKEANDGLVRRLQDKYNIRNPYMLAQIFGLSPGKSDKSILDILTGNPVEQFFGAAARMPLPLLIFFHNSVGKAINLFAKNNVPIISDEAIDDINNNQEYINELYKLKNHANAQRYKEKTISGSADIQPYIKVNPDVTDDNKDKNTFDYIGDSIEGMTRAAYDWFDNTYSKLMYGRDDQGKTIAKDYDSFLRFSLNIKNPESGKHLAPDKELNADDIKMISAKALELGIFKTQEEFDKGIQSLKEKDLWDNVEKAGWLPSSLGYTIVNLIIDMKIGGFKWFSLLGRNAAVKILNNINKAKQIAPMIDYELINKQPLFKQFVNAIGYTINYKNWGKEIHYSEELGKVANLYSQVGHPITHIGSLAGGTLGSYLWQMDNTMTNSDILEHLNNGISLGIATTMVGNVLANGARFLRPIFKGMSKNPDIFATQLRNSTSALYAFGTMIGVPLPQIAESVKNNQPLEFNNDFIQNFLIGVMFSGEGIIKQMPIRKVTRDYKNYYNLFPQVETPQGRKVDVTHGELLFREAERKGKDINDLKVSDIADMIGAKSRIGIKGLFDKYKYEQSKNIPVKLSEEPLFDKLTGQQQIAALNPETNTLYIDNTIRERSFNVNWKENLKRIYNEESTHGGFEPLLQNLEFKQGITDMYGKLKEYYDNPQSILWDKIKDKPALIKEADYIFKDDNPQEFMAHFDNITAKPLYDIFETLPIEKSEKGEMNFIDKLKSMLLPETYGNQFKGLLKDVLQSDIEPIEKASDVQNEQLGLPLESLKSSKFKSVFGDWENDPDNSSKMTTKHFPKYISSDEFNKLRNQYFEESKDKPYESVESYITRKSRGTNEPITYFRGTQTTDEGTKDNPFRIQRGNRAAGENLAGIYFTNDPKYAEGYTHSDRDFINKNKPKAANIIPSYLNIKNPIIVPEYQYGDPQSDLYYDIKGNIVPEFPIKPLEKITELKDEDKISDGYNDFWWEKRSNNEYLVSDDIDPVNKYIYTKERLLDKVNKANQNTYEIDTQGQFGKPTFPSYFTQEHLDYYKSLGYDGIVYEGGKEVIAFDPKQVLPAYHMNNLGTGLLGMTVSSLTQTPLLTNKESIDQRSIIKLDKALKYYEDNSKGILNKLNVFDFSNQFEQENNRKPDSMEELTGFINKKTIENKNRVPLTEFEAQDIFKDYNYDYDYNIDINTKRFNLDNSVIIDPNEYKDIRIEEPNEPPLLRGLDSDVSKIEFFKRNTDLTGEPLYKYINDYYKEINPEKTIDELKNTIAKTFVLVENSVPRKNLILDINEKAKTVVVTPDPRLKTTDNNNIAQWEGTPRYMLDGFKDLYDLLASYKSSMFDVVQPLLKELLLEPDIYRLSEMQHTDYSGHEKRGSHLNDEIQYWFGPELMHQGYWALPKVSGLSVFNLPTLSKISGTLEASKMAFGLDMLTLRHYLTNDTNWNYNYKMRQQAEDILPNLDIKRMILKYVHNNPVNFRSLFLANTDNKLIANLEKTNIIDNIGKLFNKYITGSGNIDWYYKQDKYPINAHLKPEGDIYADKLFREDLSEKNLAFIENMAQGKYLNGDQDLAAKINSIVTLLLNSGDTSRANKTTDTSLEMPKLDVKYSSILTTNDKLRLNTKEDISRFIPQSIDETGEYNKDWLNVNNYNENKGELNYTEYTPDYRLVSDSEIALKLSSYHSDSASWIVNKGHLSTLQSILGTEPEVSSFKQKSFGYEGYNTFLPKTYHSGTILKEESKFSQWLQKMGNYVSVISQKDVWKENKPYRVREIESYTDPSAKLIVSQTGEVLAIRDNKDQVFPAYINDMINPEPVVKKELEYIRNLHDNNMVPMKLVNNHPLTGKGAVSFIGNDKFPDQLTTSTFQSLNRIPLYIHSTTNSVPGMEFKGAIDQLKNNIANSTLKNIESIYDFSFTLDKMINNDFELNSISESESNKALKGLKLISKSFKSMDPKMTQFFSNVPIDVLQKKLSEFDSYDKLPKEKISALIAMTQNVFGSSELSKKNRVSFMANIVNQMIKDADTFQAKALTLTYIPDTDAMGDLKRLMKYEENKYINYIDEQYSTGQINDETYEKLYNDKMKYLARDMKDIIDNYIDINTNTFRPGSQGISISKYALDLMNQSGKQVWKMGSNILGERKANAGLHYLKAGRILGLKDEPGLMTFDSHTANLMSMDNDKDGFQLFFPDNNLTPDIYNKIHYYARNLGLDKGAYDFNQEYFSQLKTQKDGNIPAINKMFGIQPDGNRVSVPQNKKSYTTSFNTNFAMGNTYSEFRKIAQALDNVIPIKGSNRKILNITGTYGNYTFKDNDEFIDTPNGPQNKAAFLTDLLSQNAVNIFGHMTYNPTTALLDAFFDIKPVNDKVDRRTLYKELVGILGTLSGSSFESKIAKTFDDPSMTDYKLRKPIEDFESYWSEGKIQPNSIPAKVLVGLNQLTRPDFDLSNGGRDLLKFKSDILASDKISKLAEESKKYSIINQEEINKYQDILKKTFIPLLNSFPSKETNLYKNYEGKTDIFPLLSSGKAKNTFGSEDLNAFSDDTRYGDFKRTMAGTIYKELFERYPMKKGSIPLKSIPGKFQWFYETGNIKDKNVATGENRQVSLNKLFDNDGNLTVKWIPPDVLESKLFRNLIEYNKALSSYDIAEILTHSVANAIKQIPLDTDTKFDTQRTRSNIASSLLFSKWQEESMIPGYNFGIGFGKDNSFAALKRGNQLIEDDFKHDGYKELLKGQLPGLSEDTIDKITRSKSNINPFLIASKLSEYGLNPMVGNRNLIDATIKSLEKTGKNIYGETPLKETNDLGMSLMSLKRTKFLLPFHKGEYTTWEDKVFNMVPESTKLKYKWNKDNFNVNNLDDNQYTDVYNEVLIPHMEKILPLYENKKGWNKETLNNFRDTFLWSYSPQIVSNIDQFYKQRWGGQSGSQLSKSMLFISMVESLNALDNAGLNKVYNQYVSAKRIVGIDNITYGSTNVNNYPATFVWNKTGKFTNGILEEGTLKDITLADGMVNPYMLTQLPVYALARQIPELILPVNEFMNDKDKFIGSMEYYIKNDLMGSSEYISDNIMSISKLNSTGANVLLSDMEIKTTFIDRETTGRDLIINGTPYNIMKEENLNSALDVHIGLKTNELMKQLEDPEFFIEFTQSYGLPDNLELSTYRPDVQKVLQGHKESLKNYIKLKMVTNEAANLFAKQAVTLENMKESNLLTDDDPVYSRLDHLKTKLEKLAVEYSNLDYTNIKDYFKNYDGTNADLLNDVLALRNTIKDNKENFVKSLFSTGIDNPWQIAYFNKLTKMAKGMPVDVKQFVDDSMASRGVGETTYDIYAGIDEWFNRDMGLYLPPDIANEVFIETFGIDYDYFNKLHKEHNLEELEKEMPVGRAEYAKYWRDKVEKNARTAAETYNYYVTEGILRQPQESYINTAKSMGADIPDLETMNPEQIAFYEIKAQDYIESMINSFNSANNNTTKYFSISNRDQGILNGIPDKALDVSYKDMTDLLSSMAKVIGLDDTKYFKYQLSSLKERHRRIEAENTNDLQEITRELYKRHPETNDLNHALTLAELSTAINGRILYGKDLDRPQFTFDLREIEEKTLNSETGRYYPQNPGTYVNIAYDTGDGNIKNMNGRIVGFKKQNVNLDLRPEELKRQYGDNPLENTYAVLWNDASSNTYSIDMKAVRNLEFGRPYGERWYNLNHLEYKKQLGDMTKLANDIMDVIDKQTITTEVRKATSSREKPIYMSNIYTDKSGITEELRPIITKLESNTENYATSIKQFAYWTNTWNMRNKYMGLGYIGEAFGGIGTILTGLLTGSPALVAAGTGLVAHGATGYTKRRIVGLYGMNTMGTGFNLLRKPLGYVETYHGKTIQHEGLMSGMSRLFKSMWRPEGERLSGAASRIVGLQQSNEGFGSQTAEESLKLRQNLEIIDELHNSKKASTQAQDDVRIGILKQVAKWPVDKLKQISEKKLRSQVKMNKQEREIYDKAKPLLDDIYETFGTSLNKSNTEKFNGLVAQVETLNERIKVAVNGNDEKFLNTTIDGLTPKEILDLKLTLGEVASAVFGRHGAFIEQEANSAINSTYVSTKYINDFRKIVESKKQELEQIGEGALNTNVSTGMFDTYMAGELVKLNIGEYAKRLGQKTPFGQWFNMFEYFGANNRADAIYGNLYKRMGVYETLQRAIKSDPDYVKTMKNGLQVYDSFIYKPGKEVLLQTAGGLFGGVMKRAIPLGLKSLVGYHVLQMISLIPGSDSPWFWNYFIMPSMWTGEMLTNLLLSAANIVGLDPDMLIEGKQISEIQYVKQSKKGARATGEIFKDIFGLGAGSSSILQSLTNSLYLLGKYFQAGSNTDNMKHLKTKSILNATKAVVSPWGLEWLPGSLEQIDEDKALTPSERALKDMQIKESENEGLGAGG